jgi:hypothetical protein
MELVNGNIVFCTGRDSGAVTLNRELPHTITEWIGTTVCVSPQLGLGISPPTHLTAFQPFFLDYSMPYSVKRGEVVQLKVSLFNFLAYSLPVCMHPYLCVCFSSVQIHAPSKSIQAVTFLTCIQEVPGSNPDQDTDYND